MRWVPRDASLSLGPQNAASRTPRISAPRVVPGKVICAGAAAPQDRVITTISTG